MRLHELLRENTSKDTSVKNIADILSTQLPELYRVLGKMAEKYYAANGELGKGFRFITGGPKAKWFQDVFFTSLKPALYNLAKNLKGSDREELSNFLSDTVGDTGFRNIEDKLVPLLLRIGKITKDQRLQAGAQAAYNAIEKYQRLLDDIETSDDDKYDIPKAPKEQNPIAQQNAAVEQIVNDTLSRIDRHQAGEIRNAIAKSSNKLQALQQELRKRNINL